jgi:PAS domain S-box-containing protein
MGSFLHLDYAALFQSLPVPFMVLDRDLRFVEANPAYCAITLSKRSDLIGRHVFDVFPESGDNLKRYRDAFERALDGEENVIAMFPYSIPLPAERGGGTEMRYWSCTHTPLRDSSGQVTHLIQETKDVTALVDAREPRGALQGEVVERARQLESLSERLRSEGEYLKRMFSAAPGFMAVLSGPDLVFELANEAFCQMVGRRDLVGKTLAEALPHITAANPEMRDFGTGSSERFVAHQFPLLVERGPDGREQKIYVDFVWQPILDEDGKTMAVFVQGNDVTQRVLATQQQRLLLDEINHRVKNTLAIVQALVAQTLKTTTSPAVFADRLQARLAALSHSHNLLTASQWSGVELKSLLLQELSHYGEGRLSIDGPLTILSPRRTVNLGLVFHEMATNAAKYGALSVPEGRLEVGWSIDRAASPARLKIDWIESNGPPVHAPAQSGFGSRLIERTMRSKPDSFYDIQYLPEGLRATFDMPLETDL